MADLGVWGLPTLYSDREVQMSKKQVDAYEALRKHAVYMYEASEVTAANEGVLLNKLLQITSGCVYDSKKRPIMLGADNRLSVALESVEQAEGKAIVFCPFIPLVPMVAEYLESHGVTAYQVTGATSPKERARIFSDFQDHPRLAKQEAIVAHPGTMSHGLTLTQASLIVWYAPPSCDLEVYQQANARIARPGQGASRVQVIHLVGSKTDEKLYKRLQGKDKVQGSLLELFE